MKHDNYAGAGSVVFPKFRPARFLRSVTLRDGADVGELVISIRTLPAKRDGVGPCLYHPYQHFYPHASCEARPLTRGVTSPMMSFLSARFLRSATSNAINDTGNRIISIRTLPAKRDTRTASLPWRLVISIRTLPAKRDCTSAQKADVPSPPLSASYTHPAGVLNPTLEVYHHFPIYTRCEEDRAFRFGCTSHGFL